MLEFSGGMWRIVAKEKEKTWKKRKSERQMDEEDTKLRSAAFLTLLKEIRGHGR